MTRPTTHRMTFKQIRQASKRRYDYVFTVLVTNEISLLITWALTRTRIVPDQVTISAVCCGILGGVFYAFGSFWAGSASLFMCHILDCTDGNLARTKKEFSPIGKWLDMVGDRLSHSFVFLGVAIYFLRNSNSAAWGFLALVDGIILLNYYYAVDIALAQGITEPLQKIGKLTIRGVQVKWGLLEPVTYGFIILAPLGLLKVHIIFVMFCASTGILFQVYKNYKHNYINGLL